MQYISSADLELIAGLPFARSKYQANELWVTVVGVPSGRLRTM